MSKGKQDFDHFDVLYYINLQHRHDRNEHILQQLALTNIHPSKIHRIDAIYHKDFGELGCSQSHIKALEAFLQTSDDIKTCLIIEDDFMFRQKDIDFSNLNNFFDLKIDFDVFLLSGNIIHARRTDAPYIIKVEESQTTSGYCVTKQYAAKLLANFKEGAQKLVETGHKIHHLCLDQYWKSLQPIDNWFALYPLLGQQMASYSDIEKKVVDYGGYS
jgi:glycosyl transferase family 25